MNILRPTKLSEFIGNEHIKKCLEISINAAKIKNKPLGHILNQGGYGRGKTTLANMIADAMGGHFYPLNASTITKKHHLLELFCKLKPNDVVFIDEIHGLDISMEEFMYPAMEDFVISLPKASKEFNKESFTQINISPFTLIGATTDIGLLSGPFKSRFKAEYYLELYSIEDIVKIIRLNAPKLNLNIDDYAIVEIAKRSKMTPRLANARLEWISDFSISNNISFIKREHVIEALEMQHIDEEGLDVNDKKYLAALKKDGYKPIGLKTIVGMTGFSEETITKYIEPYLIEINRVRIGKTGRLLVPTENEIIEAQKLVGEFEDIDIDNDI